MGFKNLKINKKLVAGLILAGSLATTTLTGCVEEESRDSILKGTILENTCVVTFEDGSKEIATIKQNYCGGEANYHYHYFSVISGIYFSNEDSCGSHDLHHYKIINEESITSYLSEEDLTKAINGELDEKDIISIITRTVEPTTEAKTFVK